MYKLVFIITLSILLVLGYQQYDSIQQQAEDELQRKKYEQQKLALEKARATKSPQALNEFIQQHPDSAWLDTAVYYRDKYAVQRLIKSGDIQKLQGFIDTNADSEWVTSARQHIIKIQREQENRKIRQRVLSNQPKIDLSQTDIPLITEVNTLPTLQVDKVEKKKAVKKPNRNDATERVKRALSIYQKMGKPQIRKDEERKKQQQEDEKRLQACNRMKDQLSQFNRRTRWYKLDDSGKRVFMSKQAVALKKKEIRSNYNEHCT